MRKYSALLLILAIVVLPIRESSAQDDDTRIGIGVGFTSGIFGGGLDFVESLFSPASIYVPITFESFRLEPQFGIARSSEESGDIESSATVFELGSGIFGLAGENSTLLYYGGRIGILRFSSSVEGGPVDVESSSTNIFLGPAAGAEHFFGEDFSLGGEAQLMYTALGEDEDEDEDASSSVLRTRALFFVRMHF